MGISGRTGPQTVPYDPEMMLRGLSILSGPTMSGLQENIIIFTF